MIRCDQCHREQEAGRLPAGWKRHADRIWCGPCWQERYCLRTVTIPVVGPEDGDWEALRETLRHCWSEATMLSNWAIRELAKADPGRRPGDERLAKMPRVYLYGLAREAGMELCDPQSRTSLLTAVERKYRQRRYAARWLCSESLPMFRYPTPYPLHNQSWSIAEQEGRFVASVRLGGRRLGLLLRGGHEFRRQLAAVRRLIAGEALAGEASIYEVRASGPDHRNGLDMRSPGGGQRRPSRIMFKMVLWLPKQAVRPREGTLYLRTAGDSFWTYHVGLEGEIKHLNADHVRRWIAEHRRRLDRMADDLKYEKRWPKRTRRRMVESQEARIARMKGRMQSFCHEATAMLAKFADRQGVATVVYDDTNQAFADKFPWHAVRELLAYKLDERGIGLELVRERQAAG